MDRSRRSFLLTGTGLVVAGASPTAARLGQMPASSGPAGGPIGGPTAAQVIDRIKANVGIPWMTETVDRIVAGAPETRVRGVATTMMATRDVLERAAAAGKNLVVSHEPTFWSHQDQTTEWQADATYQAKAAIIEQHELVVFHFHDHWHRRTPDGIAVGMAREVGWDKHLVPNTQREFAFDGRTLLDLARELASRLKTRTLRVLGDPAMPVKRAIASWGYVSQAPAIPYIARPEIDLLICGETREWEAVEYVQDQIAAGKPKALIVIGHVLSEQAGMKYCAEWLKTFITDLPIEFIAADEPFWRPDQPQRGGGRTRTVRS